MKRLAETAVVRSNLWRRMRSRFLLPMPHLTWSATAFGFRNLANYAQGLRELRRVLKAGGSLAILEFAEPRGALFRHVFRFLFSPRASGHWRGDLRKCACLHLSAEFGGPLSGSERASEINGGIGIQRGGFRKLDRRNRDAAYGPGAILEAIATRRRK